MAGNVNELVDGGTYYEVLLSDGKIYKVDKDPYQSVYTPELTIVTNLDSKTAYPCIFYKSQGFVHVSGSLDLDPTAAGAVRLGISLPIASDFSAFYDCCGVAFSDSIAGQGAAIMADTTNNRAELKYIAVDTTNKGMFFNFSYRIL